MYWYAIVCYYWSCGSNQGIIACGNVNGKKNDGVGFSFTEKKDLSGWLPLILVQAELGLGLAGLAGLAGVRKRAVQDRWITDYIQASLAGLLGLFFSERSLTP